MRYIATEPVFRGGLVYEVGDSLESDTDPGSPFVLASLYKPAIERPVSVARDPRFMSSSLECDPAVQPSPSRRTHDAPVEHSTPTRLDGRSPREWRY